jgi:hypothetical protein
MTIFTEAGDEITGNMMKLARAIHEMLRNEAPERYHIPVLDTVIRLIEEERIYFASSNHQ